MAKLQGMGGGRKGDSWLSCRGISGQVAGVSVTKVQGYNG
jgi:hypothetical protein